MYKQKQFLRKIISALYKVWVILDHSEEIVTCNKVVHNFLNL
jgi:hypothetical protein